MIMRRPVESFFVLVLVLVVVEETGFLVNSRTRTRTTTRTIELAADPADRHAGLDPASRTQCPETELDPGSSPE